MPLSERSQKNANEKQHYLYVMTAPCDPIAE